MKRTKIIPLSLLSVVLTGGIVYWGLTASPRSPRDERNDDAPPAKAANVETEDERTHRQLLGVWQDDYRGKRTMTLHGDGSGTMLVELSGAEAFLFAAELRFDMKWSLDGKKLTKKTVSGEPADKVNLILKTMGDTAEDTILEITNDRLLLLDKNGKTRYDWRRVMKDETSRE